MDLGPLPVTAEKAHALPLPPLVVATALPGGIAIASRRRQNHTLDLIRSYMTGRGQIPQISRIRPPEKTLLSWQSRNFRFLRSNGTWRA